MKNDDILNLSPSESSWFLIVNKLNEPLTQEELLSLLDQLKPFLENWPKTYLIAPAQWILNQIFQEEGEPRLSVCHSFEAEIFFETSYLKTTAEKVLSLPLFKDQPALSQLQTLFSLFSYISDYNHVSIVVSELHSEDAIEDQLNEILNKSCAGPATPSCSFLPVQNEKDIEKAILYFLENWFTSIDGFPKVDYNFFLNENILPTLKKCIPFNGITSIISGSKEDRSYEFNQLLAIGRKNHYLILNMHCDIY